VRLYSIKNQVLVRSWHVAKGTSLPNRKLEYGAIAFSNHQPADEILIAEPTGEIAKYSIQTGDLLTTYRGQKGPIHSLSVSPVSFHRKLLLFNGSVDENTTYVLSSGEEETIVWSLESGDKIFSFANPNAGNEEETAPKSFKNTIRGDGLRSWNPTPR
jgi:hypothetical protein